MQFSFPQELIVLIPMVIVFFVLRRRRFNEYIRLDELNRERLRSGLGYFMPLLTIMYLIVAAPVLIGLYISREQGMIAMGLAILAIVIILLWASLGYAKMKTLLDPLGLPESYVRAHMAERWAYLVLIIWPVLVLYQMLKANGLLE